MVIKVYYPRLVSRIAALNNYNGVNTKGRENLCLKTQLTHSCNYSNEYDKKSPTSLFGVNELFISPIAFKGYYGNSQPLQKLFWITAQKDTIYADDWTKNHIYSTGFHKWVNAAPYELLKRTPEETIKSLCTVTNPHKHYPHIPVYITSPDYGDKWGRHANYIEINPRLVSKYDGEKVSEGLFGVMKLLLGIPPTAGKGANCIILSQLYPSLCEDGTVYDGSLYCANLHIGISKNLTSPNLIGKMGDDEQVKAFNDMAHLLGFKTGIRMPLSAGQLKVQGRNFDWAKDEKAYIDACVWAIELGFDSIYFDSGKHILDKDGYIGIGELPNEKQFAYITAKIREQTGRTDLSFIGEKSNDNPHYKDIGLTAGTDWGKADNIFSVKHEAGKQSYSESYAAGPEVSNDNDCGELRYEERLNRLNSCMWGFENSYDRLPSYMQLHDIFPLSPYINTHEAMMHVKKMQGEGWTDCERHWNGVFNTSDDARRYTQSVYHIFENVIKN